MVRPRVPDDADLVQRLSIGDDHAYALVLDAWSAGMLRLARSFVTTDDSAKEVLQDTWMAVITGLGSFEGRSSFRTWVYRILVNTAKRRGERESHVVPWSSWEPDRSERGPTVEPIRFQDASEDYPGHWRVFPQQWPSPESAALTAEMRTTVSRAIESLPARQRIVVTLRDVEGYGADEVCLVLSISGANQRVLLHRGRAVVRTALEAYFATAEHVSGDPAEVSS